MLWGHCLSRASVLINIIGEMIDDRLLEEARSTYSDKLADKEKQLMLT